MVSKGKCSFTICGKKQETVVGTHTSATREAEAGEALELKASPDNIARLSQKGEKYKRKKIVYTRPWVRSLAMQNFF